MKYLHYSKGPTRSLVESRPGVRELLEEHPYPLFGTISPSDKVMVTTAVKITKNGKLTRQQWRYGQLPVCNQQDYCLKILEEAWLSQLENYTCIGTWELNKNGQVHLHFILVSLTVNTDYDLADFRKRISLDPLCVKNQGRSRIDHMNHVYYIDECNYKGRLEYMDKDHDQKIHFKYSSFIISHEPFEFCITPLD